MIFLVSIVSSFITRLEIFFSSFIRSNDFATPVKPWTDNPSRASQNEGLLDSGSSQSRHGSELWVFLFSKSLLNGKLKSL